MHSFFPPKREMNFNNYRKNRTIYSDIIQHSHASENTLDQFINAFPNKDPLQEQSDLDLLHLILKHARSCELETCQTRSKQKDLFQLVIDSALPYVNSPHDLPYPLLICMIDIVKNDVSHSLNKATLKSFLMIGCTLWNHPKIYQCRKSMELCTLIIPLVPNDENVLKEVLKYIQLCRKHIRQEDINRFKSIEYTEFFYQPRKEDGFTFDRVTLKLLIELILCICLKRDSRHISAIQKETEGKISV